MLRQLLRSTVRSPMLRRARLESLARPRRGDAQPSRIPVCEVGFVTPAAFVAPDRIGQNWRSCMPEKPQTGAVFVHGNPEAAAVWGPLLAELRHLDAVTLSLPGFRCPGPRRLRSHGRRIRGVAHFGAREAGSTDRVLRSRLRVARLGSSVAVGSWDRYLEAHRPGPDSIRAGPVLLLRAGSSGPGR